jgi:hypothetical protein
MAEEAQTPEIPEIWLFPHSQGWSVIPLEKLGKKPLISWEQYQVNLAPLETIKGWARFNGNVGIITGALSGIVVLDLDSDEAIAEAKRRGLPENTVVVQTGRGEHWYFRHPGGTIGNRAGIFAGADLRGDGGYVVAAESIHKTGAIYTYRQPSGLFDIAPMPQWLFDLATKPDTVGSKVKEAEPIKGILQRQPSLTSAYGARAVEGELAILRRATEGQRNNQLNISAFLLAQLAAGGEVEPEATFRLLRDAALSVGLSEREVEATLSSGWNAGLEKPRTPADWQDAELADGFDQEVWPEPSPLPDVLLPVPHFSPDMLPADLRDWVVDIAERMNVPLDFVGVTAMVALGSVIGRRVGIKPQANTDWLETANLWGCVVARPGAIKSPAVAQVLAPLHRLEAAAAKEYAEAIKLHKALEDVLKIDRGETESQIKKSIKVQTSDSYRRQAAQQLMALDVPEAPPEKRFVTSDCTAEKMGEICAANPDGILVHRDELITLFADLDREEKATARGFYLSGWGGNQGYTFDRIGRGTIRIPAVNISVIGTTQPNRLASYIYHSLRSRDDGMVQRLQLICMPDIDGHFVEVDRHPNETAKLRAFECFEGLSSRRFVEIGAEVDPTAGEEGIPFFRFSEAAREVFVSWRTELESTVRDPDITPALAAHYSKFRGLIPRLALIFHLASGGTGAVSLEAVEQALVWANYLEAHARRIYVMAATGVGLAAARAILSKVRKGQLADGFTARDITQKNWAGLGREVVGAGLELLIEMDWLRKTEVRGRGRPKEIYLVNPLAVLTSNNS